MKKMNNEFDFFDVCNPSQGKGRSASGADVSSTVVPDKGNPEKIIWRLSFDQRISKQAGFTPGETKLVFDYREGCVTLKPHPHGRLLSKGEGGGKRDRIRFALPRQYSGFIDRGAFEEADVSDGEIRIVML